MFTGAEYILRKLSLIGVKYIFGIPGSHIDPLLTASVSSEIEPIITCHELSGGYMADGYSRASKKLGVLFGIGGPGSNNMVTAVNTARIEKSPMLIITGDVPTFFSDVPGFQCGNSMGSNDDAIFKIISKYSKRIENIDDLVLSLDEAISIALSPPFGPAHLIVPFNVFNENTSVVPIPVDYNALKNWKTDNSDKTVTFIKNLILSKKKLIFWIGSSLNRKEQSKQIIDLVKKFQIPVASTYSAKGVIPEDGPLALGNFGFAGTTLSKEILLSEEPDVIIGFDIEQNERNTWNWNQDLYKGKELILINYPGSYSNIKMGKSVEDNPFYILKSLHTSLMNEVYDNHLRKHWVKKILKTTISKEIDIPVSKIGQIEPGRLIQILQEEMPKESILCVDSGNVRIFPGLYWKAKTAESLFTAAKMAPLGWAIASGIGCKFARNEPVVVFTGDGSMQMHGIELKTAVKHHLPMLVIISNNNAFGSVYTRFSKISDEAAKMTSITEIDWNLFSKSFGAEVFDVTTEENFIICIRNFLTNQKLTILNVRTPVKPYIHDLSLIKPAFN